MKETVCVRLLVCGFFVWMDDDFLLVLYSAVDVREQCPEFQYAACLAG